MYNLFRKVKQSIAPNLVVNRANLDREIEQLTVQRDLLRNTMQSVLNERNLFAAMLNKPPRQVDWIGMGVEAPPLSFKGYAIPDDLVRMTGAGPESFEGISAAHLKIIQETIGIEPHHTFLEPGCGIGRDAIPLTEVLTQGRYVGVDVIRSSIEWCSRNITPRHPNFTFYHFDIEDQTGNPHGKLKTKDTRFPLEDATVDRIILFSVFTHMYVEDIGHYLREFYRVLKPGALVYATAFIFDDNILQSAWKTLPADSNLRFEHQLAPGCRVSNPRYPLGAIAFTREVMDLLVKQSGLTYVKFFTGAWSGYYEQPGQLGQDGMILTK